MVRWKLLSGEPKHPPARTPAIELRVHSISVRARFYQYFTAAPSPIHQFPTQLLNISLWSASHQTLDSRNTDPARIDLARTGLESNPQAHQQRVPRFCVARHSY